MLRFRVPKLSHTAAASCFGLLLWMAIPCAGQSVLFSDAFGTPVPQVFQPGPVGSTGWTFVRAVPNQSDVRYGYDYSAIGIPEAPNSQPGDTATSGIALRTNVSAGTESGDQGGVYYDDASFTGKYRVEVDMWLNWANDAEQIGTTEHAALFVGKDTAANPANPLYPASTGAGAMFSSDGDCSNCDHILLKNEAELDTFSGQYSVRLFDMTENNQNPDNQQGYDTPDFHTDPLNGDLLDLPALFPSFTIPGSSTIQPAGTVGYRWITITADVDTNALGEGTGPDLGTTTFTVTIADSGASYVLGTVDNSVLDNPDDGVDTGEGPVSMSGRVSLALTDFFSSVASDISLATVVFDNLVVTQIESAGLPGDYNDDGVVDAADYTVWRDSTDSTQMGYDVWADNYGAVAPPPAASIPEPAALAAAICVLSGLATCRTRRPR